jgi:aminoglycoside 6'-N-acetyltransferase
MRAFTPKLTDAEIEAGGGVILRALRQDDAAFLDRMLRELEIAKWFNADSAELVALIDEPTVSPFLILADGTEVGYAQVYWANGDAFWRDLGMPRETMGFDLSLSAGLRNKGLGPRVIRALTARAFDMDGVVQAIIDPHPDNARAVRAYGKCGFLFGAPQPGYYGDPMLLGVMTREKWAGGA